MKKNEFVGLSQGQKNIFFDFLLSRSMSNKHGLDGVQRSKKNIFFDFSTFAFYVEQTWSWSCSKVKKTFSTFGLNIEKHGLF